MLAHLAAIADEDVDGRENQLQQRLPVALFHLKAEAFHVALRTLGLPGVAVLQVRGTWETAVMNRDRLHQQTTFPQRQQHRNKNLLQLMFRP